MGIRGLYSFLFWTASNTIKKQTLSEWSGKRLGVDILCLLYRSRSLGIPLLWNLSHFLATCRAQQIQLVVVFDGSPPPEKSEIMAQRRKLREDTDKFCNALETALEGPELSVEQRKILNQRIQVSRRSVPQIRADDRNEVKQLLYATGTPFVHSQGEADTLLAYMEQKGQIDAVISTDYDFIARGVKNLLVPASENLEGTAFHCFQLDAICTELGLTQQQLREFACLLGTDYAPGLVYQRGQTSRLLYRRFKVLGSLDALMAKMKLPDEKKADVRHSLAELDVENRLLDDLLRTEQQERLAKGSPIEPEWIHRHLANGEVCEGIRVFLEPKVDGVCEI